MSQSTQDTVEKLRVGLRERFEREITEDDVVQYARNSGDDNPLHVDPDYAAQTNYGGRIVHGAFQVGLASAMLGTRLPGADVLLTSLNARFPAPLRFPCQVRVSGEIIAWNPAARAGRLRVQVLQLPDELLTAEVSLGFSLHETESPAASPEASATADASPSARSVVLVTGAAGGLGQRLCRALSGTYDVLAIDRVPVAKAPGVTPLSLDFGDPGWIAEVPPGPLYGAVHCAWPSMPRGGLLEMGEEVMRTQLDFGTTQMVALGRLLTERVTEEGGRLVALGSIVGLHRPNPNVAAYSLGKAALEHTAKLLAAEVAYKGVTVNVVAPAFVPVGINRQADERRRKIEAAQVPLGRICEPDDVVSTVRWLLSAEAGFVSGQTVGLTGAQL